MGRSVFRSRVWVFGDDINTDLLMPGHVMFSSTEAQVREIFSTNRPGWIDLVEQGDILVAGRDFGSGSSRPAARALVAAGIGCLLAESVNGLFLRGCIAFGLPAFGCPGIHSAVTEGDVVTVDTGAGTVSVPSSPAPLRLDLPPDELLDIMLSGGILPKLEQDQLISPPLKDS